MTFTAITLLLVLSLSVEYIVEIFKGVFPALDSDVKGVSVSRIIAFIFGLITCIVAQIDFFEMLGVTTYTVPYVGYVISAIFVAGGSGKVHDLAKLLRTTSDLNEVAYIVEVENLEED